MSSTFPLRSPAATTRGICLLGRIIDKIRLNAEGKLPEGWHVGIIPGKRTFDDRLCKFLRVDWDALSARVLQGGSDEEILDWCFSQGHQPDAEQIEIWNTFMQKRGWNDPSTPGFIQQKADAGLAHRDDIVTFFHLMDVEEGRSA
jgi:gluconokinase